MPCILRTSLYHFQELLESNTLSLFGEGNFMHLSLLHSLFWVLLSFAYSRKASKFSNSTPRFFSNEHGLPYVQNQNPAIAHLFPFCSTVWFGFIQNNCLQMKLRILTFSCSSRDVLCTFSTRYAIARVSFLHLQCLCYLQVQEFVGVVNTL